MNAYLDIKLLPDPEFKSTTLMNALFSKLHRGLVAFGESSIGVSFPDLKEKKQKKLEGLGECLRVHGSTITLAKFMEINWLKGMRDHIEVSEIQLVPHDTQYCFVQRVQAKSNPERLRRRLISRKGIDEVAAKEAIPDDAAEKLLLPFVEITSQSTGQKFRLFVKHSIVKTQSLTGSFNAYGLSATATIPWF